MKSIKSLLRTGFVILLIFIVIQSSILYWIMSDNNQQMKRTINGDFAGSLLISRMAIEGNKLRRYEKEFFIYISDQEKMNKYENEWQQSYDRLEILLNKALDKEEGHWSVAELTAVENWLVALKGYGSGFLQVVNDVKKGRLYNTIDANNAIANAKKRFKVLLDGTEAGGVLRYQRASEEAYKIQENNKMLAMILLGAALSGIMIVLIMLIKIPNAISDSISILSDSAERISLGHLNEEIPLSQVKEEFLTIARTLERMRLSQKVFMEKFQTKDF